MTFIKSTNEETNLDPPGINDNQKDPSNQKNTNSASCDLKQSIFEGAHTSQPLRDS